MWLLKQVIAAVLVGAALAFIFVTAGGGRARGAGPVMFDCAELAVIVAAYADFRDTRAKLELVVKLSHAHYPTLPPAQLAVLEREIRRLWRERLPAEEAGHSVFRRCRAQLGDMGRES